MPQSDIINEYEAASITFISPRLLRWFTSHAPKSGTKRKLKIADECDGQLLFERKEVLEFDAWLKQPWPRKDGKRPNIPSAVKSEIEVEANGACAMCHGHKDSCEAAHLDPVSKSSNNHPENLIWLCSNHHTVYDKGLYGPKDIDADFVAALKTSLRHYKVMQWRMQAKLSVKVLAILENCDRLNSQLKMAETPAQVAAVERLAKDVLDVLPALAPISEKDPRFSDYQKVSAEIGRLRKSKKPIATRLQRASQARAAYVAALGMVACPLCEAKGWHNGEECPVCHGDREIEEQDAARIDISAFEDVDCPLCEGKRNLDGADCPACGAEGRMERRFAEQLDVNDYSSVDCPVCEGTGSHLGEPCHACGGEGEMERRHADLIDTRDYEVVPCPLCEGKGRHQGDDCRECNGEGEMQKRFADRVDTRGYDEVECRVCHGTRRLHGEDCPACGGEGKVERQFLDRIEPRDYKLVDCPVCENSRNRRDECRACGGEGKVQRRHADQIDPRDYR